MDKQRPLPPSQVGRDPAEPVGSAVVSSRIICTDTTSPNKDADFVCVLTRHTGLSHEKTCWSTTSSSPKKVSEFNGVRSLQQTDFVWPTLAEINRIQDESEGKLGEHDHVTRVDGAVRFLPDNQIWVPKEATNLQIRLVVIAHCGSAGYRGIQTTLNALTERFMKRTEKIYIYIFFCKECLHCCVLRERAVVPRTLGTATQVSKLNKVIHFDFLHMSDLVDICEEHEYKELLIIEDEFSHFENLVPCISTTAEVAALALQDWFSS